MIHRTVFLILFVLILNGCSNLSHAPVTPVEWQSHQEHLKNITYYKISGKLGYISPKERRSFNFQWSKQPALSQLRLSTFLGQTVLKIEITPQNAKAETYDGETYTAKTPEALLLRLTGLNIPLSSLNAWLLGLPAMADHYTLNQNHILGSLEKRLGDQQWQVRYDTYTDMNVQQLTLPLPTKLSLWQNTTKINLQISRWKLDQ